MILCCAAFIVILSHMRLVGCRLGTPGNQLGGISAAPLLPGRDFLSKLF